MIPQKYRSRKFIVSLATAIVGLIVVFVPERASEVESLVMQIAGLVVMVGSMTGWVIAEAAVDRKREEVKAEQAKRGTGPGYGGFASPTVLAAALAAGVAGAAATGCVNGFFSKPATPEQTYFRQVQTFNEVVSTAIRAKQSGLIEQSTYDLLVFPAIASADEALDEAKLALDEGRTLDFDAAIRSADRLIDRLVLKIEPLEDQLRDIGSEGNRNDPGPASRNPSWHAGLATG